MGSLFSSPKPPNPKKVAAAQLEANVGTAKAQQRANMVNQTGPSGSLNYVKTGVDPETGMPIYSANTVLSEGEQGIYDTGVQNRQGMANVGQAQLGNVSETMSQPVDLSSTAIDKTLMDREMEILQPYLDKQRESWGQDMANRGVAMNSDVYQKSLGTQHDRESRQLTDLLLRGRGTALQEMLAQRNQPLNELNAFRTGSQVSMPNFINTPQTPMGAAPDMASLYNNNYQAKLQQQQGALGGLAGLATNVALAPMTGGGSLIGSLLGSAQ